MFLYNLLGYAAAPLIGGAVAEVSSLKWGYRSCILAVVVATAFMAVSIGIAKGMIGKDLGSEASLELPSASSTNGGSKHADASVVPGGGEPSRPPPSVPESELTVDGGGTEPDGPPPALVAPEGEVTAL